MKLLKIKDKENHMAKKYLSYFILNHNLFFNIFTFNI